jgi:uncharacterized protein
MSVPFLSAKWKNLVMVNFPVDPSILEPYLPAGTKLDYFEGQTYVSLVGFLFAKTKIFGIPVPFFGTFEEITLRFYVFRKEGNLKKRGVVFINEAVPHKTVAAFANLMFKEKYSVVSTNHYWEKNSSNKLIEYYWAKNDKWNAIKIEAGVTPRVIAFGSLEEFIFEHSIGYTKINTHKTESYEIVHPRWMIHDVHLYSLQCDFEAMYGSAFAHLSKTEPSSVFLAQGSSVAINWKREVIRPSEKELEKFAV